MKIILTASAIAMISAGIYGAADFGNDLRQGKMIQYEREEDHLTAHMFVSPEAMHNDNSLLQKIALNEEKKRQEESAKQAEAQKINFSEFVGDFSRGEPVNLEEIVPITVSLADSAQVNPAPVSENVEGGNTSGNATEDKKVEENNSSSTTATQNTEVKTEKPELNVRYFSRGGFKKPKS